MRHVEVMGTKSVAAGWRASLTRKGQLRWLGREERKGRQRAVGSDLSRSPCMNGQRQGDFASRGVNGANNYGRRAVECFVHKRFQSRCECEGHRELDSQADAEWPLSFMSIYIYIN